MRRGSRVLGLVVALAGLARCASHPPPPPRADSDFPPPAAAAPLRAPERLEDAESALLALEDRRAFDEPALAAAARSPDPRIRARAALALGRIGDERASRLTSTEVVGRELVSAQGCSSCHVVGGQGGSVGPSLDGVASRRTAAYIHSYIENPKNLNPTAVMPAFLPPLTHEQVEDITQYLLTLR
jgi:mono/diheme cytochrome c family protein